jgi:hypothetical protein
VEKQQVRDCYLTPSGEIVSDGLLFSARWRNSKYTFYSLWFDQSHDSHTKKVISLENNFINFMCFVSIYIYVSSFVDWMRHLLLTFEFVVVRV